MEATHNFAEEMWKSCGIRYLFFMAMETPSQTVNTGMLDFNDSIGGGKSYQAVHKNWQIEGIDLQSWNDHNSDYYNSQALGMEVETSKAPRSHFTLPQNAYGEPILPNPQLVPQTQTARTWRQNLVRTFLSRHYGTSPHFEILFVV
jgi:hypothetical protein